MSSESNASKSPTMLKNTSYSSRNDNIITSNSYSTLNEEEDEEEDVENVYDETANLFPNTKTSRSSFFTAAAGVYQAVLLEVNVESKIQNDINADDADIRPIYDEEPMAEIVQNIIFIVDSGCTKHMMGNLKLLCTKFLNKTLHAFVKEEGIEHQTSIARTPEQNNVVERRNHTLVEVAQTMLLASKLPLFFWVEAIAIACYTQNRDGENLDKKKEKEDPYIFVGYSTQSKGYRVYNKRTRLIVESIHINFNEIKELTMTSDDNTSGLAPQRQKTYDHNVKNSDFKTTTMNLQVQSCPLFKEYFTAGNNSVSKSFGLSDNHQQTDTQPTLNVQPTIEPTTPKTNVNAEETNIDQAADV
ncbi:retrovirus-related pol polyprotein from transposon TNT 1-94 [Tanacetum coccineum]|uniref:Retrovirus-related pol polyprotein from transposon TNT 1-94 n=1 Tax=Tanacetum coccineum TaxID=301880 RepID=A0ABQ5HFY2_9ASTR